MTSAQEYYDGLIAQGYDLEQAKIFTQQHFAGFSPAAPMSTAPIPAEPMVAAPMVAATMGVMPASGNRPGVLNWVALGLTAAAITLIFIAMFSNSWMTGENNDISFSYGFSEWEVEFGDDVTRTYELSGDGCKDEECDDISAAGTTGLIFLWIAVVVAIGSLVLIGLNSFGVYQSKFGMISAFVSGGLAITGAIIWLIMFPEMDFLDDYDLGPGIAFYLAMIGGVLGIGAGACEIKS